MPTSERDRKVSRRHALVALAATPLLGRCRARPPRGSQEEVLIVGGGLTGLLLLYRLQQCGIRAHLLEANERVGGRIFTLRDGLAAGLYGEAGAERIPRLHRRLRALLDEFGLEVVPYPTYSETTELVWQGRSYSFRTTEDLPETVFGGLNDFEREGAPFDLHFWYAHEFPPPPPEDRRSAIQWYRDQGLTKAGETLLRMFCFHDVDRISAAAFHRIALGEQEVWSADRLAGGTDTLVEAVYQPVTRAVSLGREVTAIQQSANGVRVHERNGRIHTAGRVVVCLPLEPLRRLALSNRVSRQLERRLQGLAAAKEAKIHFTCPRMLLTREILPAQLYRDRFPHAVWPLTGNEHHVVLNAVAAGSQVKRVQQAFRNGRSGMREIVQKELPHYVFDKQAYFGHDFCDDVFAGGVAAYERPGAAVEKGVIEDGRILYAGSDFSHFSGWMEGAIEAAEQAVAALTPRRTVSPDPS